MTNHTSPIITDQQRQIIIGTVLGGSGLHNSANCKSYHLSMYDRNEKWIKCKAQELIIIAAPTPFHFNGKTWFWHSRAFPIFNEMHDLLYDEQGQRKVDMPLLDSLRNIALAVWFLDAGKVINEEVVLSVHKYKMAGSAIIIQYFNELGLTCERILNKEHIKLKMNKEASKKFIKLISHLIPAFLRS